jgi:UDP-N-acetyl-D-mannosaminuronic acid transferase (WecB/TagA/CpsF family)
MIIRLFKTKDSLIKNLIKKEINIYSCLNGYTLQSLLNDGLYDNLLMGNKIGFVIDGIAAHFFFKMRGLKLNKICGRDLMSFAIKNHSGPLVIIGGYKKQKNIITQRLGEYFGKKNKILIPPLFSSKDDVKKYSKEICKLIPNGSLVLIFISSPTQDILAGHLLKATTNTTFVNAGAVIDDIKKDRLKILRFFSKFNSEWLYRLTASPLRTLFKLYKTVRLTQTVVKGKYNIKVLN